ncbi:MAG: hypothetical protein JWO02_370 [Solirubrobacterales bacterium]|nr:hypothetical protein [Solirubrobacterales bacterium]
MTDRFPRWPSAWLDERDLATEEVVARAGDVELVSGLRSDGVVLLSVSWPGGRRYLLVDPVGHQGPQALRAGEKSDDAETARVVEALWSQALNLAKHLIDGDVELPLPQSRSGWRPWRRGSG